MKIGTLVICEVDGFARFGVVSSITTTQTAKDTVVRYQVRVRGSDNSGKKVDLAEFELRPWDGEIGSDMQGFFRNLPDREFAAVASIRLPMAKTLMRFRSDS